MIVTAIVKVLKLLKTQVKHINAIILDDIIYDDSLSAFKPYMTTKNSASVRLISEAIILLIKLFPIV